ncbi:UNVERIFIED_CONTAM: hypothetical protein GTU68_016433 [Idotea baltica]|nr:hypothetical protein [Idotea baltica]
MREHNIKAEYVAIDVAEGDFESTFQRLASEGANGLNITQPHKFSALAAATTVSETAQRIGASNTLIRRDNEWHAENTDAPGFRYTLRSAGIESMGTRFALIGAGGAARGVVEALTSGGASVHILNRTPSKAAMLAADFLNVTYSEEAFNGYVAGIENFDVLINTASFGYEGADFGLPAGGDRLFYDISYGNAAEATLRAAHGTGWRTMDGLAMLVAQAAYSFEHWFDIFPDIEPVLKMCRTTVEKKA